MHFSSAVILVLASKAVAQGAPFYGPGSSALTGPTVGSSSSLSLPPASAPPYSGSKTIVTYLSCTDTSPVVGTVTDIITSTYCSKCDHQGAVTTEYLLSLVDVCPTGLTTPVYTITATITGNPASYTPPTTVPPEFTVYETVCTACEDPEATVTVTVPSSTTALTPTQAPIYPNSPASLSYSKPTGTAYTAPPAPPAPTSSGPAMVTVSGASTLGSPIWFFTVVASVMGAMFAGLIML